MNLRRASQVFLSIAVVSLALAVFLDIRSTRTEEELSVDCVDGFAIVLAILIAVIVGSLNSWQKEKPHGAPKKDDSLVKVIRDGGKRLIPICQVVVGDVMLFEPGDVISCDGVFLSDHNVRCHEPGTTGGFKSIKKLSFEECIALRDKRLRELGPDGPSRVELLGCADCFIVSGSNVLEGVGTYVVIAVGSRSLGLFIVLSLT